MVESFLGNKDDDNITILLGIIGNTYEIYYVQRKENNSTVSYGKRIVKNSLKYIWFFHTSKLIITNSRLHHSLLKKRNGQKVMQMWHGIPWKKLVYDQTNINFQGQEKELYLTKFSNDVEKWDFLWCPSLYAEEKFSSAFRYTGEYIKQMYPADFELINSGGTEEKKVEIKERLKINEEKTVFLYMPTFRENHMISSGKYSFITTLDIEKFMEDKKDAVLLVRSHYLINEKILFINANIINVSSFNSVAELYLISDILITDYSSAIYSYSLLRKPIISLQFDKEEYLQNRGLYEDAIKDMNVLEISSDSILRNLDFSKLVPANPQNDIYDFSPEYLANKVEKIMTLEK